MGAGELGTLLGVVCALLIGALTFQGKGALRKLEALEARIVGLEKDSAVIAASKVAERVAALEHQLTELVVNVKHIIDMLEKQAR